MCRAGLEAMAEGAGIVATRVGGIPATIADGVEALLVEPGDSAAPPEALRLVLADDSPRRALGAAARARLVRDFSPTRVLKEYLALYSQLLALPRERSASRFAP